MGSSFSVVNNTNKPIWVSHGVCKAALFGSIGGVLTVVSFGAGTIAFAAGAAAIATDSVVVAILEAEGLVIAAEEAAAISAEGWSYLSTVTGLLDAGTGITANLVGDKKDRVMSAKKKLQEVLNGYTRVEPGSRYTASGTLSLVLTAYVIYDDGQMASHDCWTGPTAGSDNEYPVTEYF